MDEEDESGITSGASWLTIGNVLSRVIGRYMLFHGNMVRSRIYASQRT